MFLCPRCRAFSNTSECAHCNPPTTAASSPPATTPLTKDKLFVAGIAIAAAAQGAAMMASQADTTEARYERGTGGAITLLGFVLAAIGLVRWLKARKTQQIR